MPSVEGPRREKARDDGRNASDAGMRHDDRRRSCQLHYTFMAWLFRARISGEGRKRMRGWNTVENRRICCCYANKEGGNSLKWMRMSLSAKGGIFRFVIACTSWIFCRKKNTAFSPISGTKPPPLPIPIKTSTALSSHGGKRGGEESLQYDFPRLESRYSPGKKHQLIPFGMAHS